MPSTFSQRRTRRQRLAWLLLPTLVLRVLIPMGFMPVHGAPFSVEICPEGFPTQLLTHIAHHHDHGGGGQARSVHCVFGITGGGPLSESTACGASPASPPVVSPPPATPVFFVRLVHLPEPRGPPAA